MVFYFLNGSHAAAAAATAAVNDDEIVQTRLIVACYSSHLSFTLIIVMDKFFSSYLSMMIDPHQHTHTHNEDTNHL